MIHVIASISIKEGTLEDIKKIYASFAPKVEKEMGCLMYCPTVDYNTDIHTQEKDTNIVTVIEKWESIEAFNAHLNTPHVFEFREDIKGIVENVSIKVLEDILR